MLEETFKKKIMKDTQQELDAYSRKMSPYGNAGWPDIFILRNKTLFIEAKQSENHDAMFKEISIKRPIQNVNRKKIIQNGGNYWLVGVTKKNKIIMTMWKPYDTINQQRFSIDKYSEFKGFLYHFLRGGE